MRGSQGAAMQEPMRDSQGAAIGERSETGNKSAAGGEGLLGTLPESVVSAQWKISRIFVSR